MPQFFDLAQAFVNNFSQRDELGASLCLHHKGQVVVDLWGGIADQTTGMPWVRDTISVIFSATKPATALCIHLLEERGLISLDAPIADYWPEYARNGKSLTTIRMTLDHTAGVPAIQTMLKADCLTDHDYMITMLEQAAPIWQPGSRTAYHPLTMGFILAEIVQRVDGRSLGRFFADEIAKPLGLDFWIGLPEIYEPRVAPIYSYRPPKEAMPTPFSTAIREQGSPQNLFLFNHGDWQARGVNTIAGRRAEIGAANGITNAVGLAGLYASLIPNGLLGLSKARLSSFSQATSATHVDGMLLQPTRFGPGFMLRMDNRKIELADSMILGANAFGHVGAGGSLGFFDPKEKLAFGYTMNKMGPGFLLNQRGQTLVDAAYNCIEIADKKYDLEM